MSRIHDWLSTGAMQSRNSAASHARPLRSSMRFIARRTTSSLTARVRPVVSVPLVLVWPEDEDTPAVQRFRELVLAWQKSGELWKV